MLSKVSNIIEKASQEHFSEEGYTKYNKDVREAINHQKIKDGWTHFELFGEKEERKQFNIEKIKSVVKMRASKLEKLRLSLRNDLTNQHLTQGKLSFLSEELKEQFHIEETSNISSHGYDPRILELIEEYKNGMILDCGCGLRSNYYSNVLNFEIANYWSTDVLGVGEVLPFKDNTFDAVISVAVLEHVKDPFMCSKEIIRVLKRGGKIFSAIPFLQPYHGYPHHYYNMTHQGHKNLYEKHLKNINIEVIPSLKPIHTLTWFLNSYINGLSPKLQDKFKNFKIGELIDSPQKYLAEDFVNSLREEVNFELASGTLLTGLKI